MDDVENSTVLIFVRNFLCWDEENIISAVEVTLDKNGNAQFFLPTVESHNQIRISAFRQTETSKSYQNSLSLISKAIKCNCLDDLHTYESSVLLQPLLSSGYDKIQLWPYSPQLTTDSLGNLRFALLSNNLTANRQLFLEAMTIHGKHLFRRLTQDESESREACIDQDGELGHYKCTGLSGPGQLGEIKCLSGWQGRNCLKAVCDNGCGDYGFCVSPGRCICLKGWSGKLCATFSRYPGCQNSSGPSGTDCGWWGRWKVGWGGKRGFRLMSKELNRTNPSVDASVQEDADASDIRTWFTTSVEVQLEDDWRTESRASIYYLETNPAAATQNEYVMDVFHLKGADDYQNSVRSQNKSTLGLRFSTDASSPSQPIRLRLEPPASDNNPDTITDKTAASPTEGQNGSIHSYCFVRISDSALKGMEDENNKVFDLTMYLDLIKDYANSPYTSVHVNYVRDAFRWVGLTAKPMHSYPLVQQTRPCPVYAISRQGPLNSAIMMERNVNLLDIKKQPRLRTFFPEVWLFDAQPMKTYSGHEISNRSWQGLEYNLTTPDSLTAWVASAYCLTRTRGLWIANSSELLVTLPFSLDIRIPKEVKRYETVRLPVNLAMRTIRPVGSKQDKLCLAVKVSIQEHPTFRLESSPISIQCLCEGETKMLHFNVKPIRLGKMPVIVRAIGQSDSIICSKGFNLAVDKYFV
ncbi:unnamed protein product, partial [Protopolystoma xenopodis]